MELHMQVTQLDDRITHAVIGGKQAQSFEIAQTAEFFRIMSSSLYSNKKLAVIREVLCNAWDAHVEAGCTDLAVDVTLTDSKLIIRDYGKGIHNDMIVPIYGTYGGSTKAANDEVTGGFGLGCKAPFAYVDHFEVTSFHQGIKTIYNMSLSSAQVKGKPGIQTIVSLPTDQTGLQVSMDIEAKDQHSFHGLILRIAAAGEMKVVLNNHELKVLPFSSAKQGFLTVTDGMVESAQSRVHLRYGHVIYPIHGHAEYRKEMERAVQILEHATGRNSYSGHPTLYLVLQAAPNSISVTPSRETVEMTDHTIGTIKQLLKKFCEGFESDLSRKSVPVAAESISRVWINNRPEVLFDSRSAIPNLKSKDGKEINPQTLISDFGDLSRKHLGYHYPQHKKFRVKDLTLRVDALIESGFDRMGLARSFRTEMLRHERLKDHWGRDRREFTWFPKKLVWPLIRDMAKEPLLIADQLLVYAGERSERNSTVPVMHPAKGYNPAGTWPCLPFLRGHIILSHNRSDVLDRAGSFPVMRNWLGEVKDSLVYIVPRNAAKIEAARDFFSKKGFHLVDLTEWQKWETAPVKQVRASPRKKLKKGVALLSSILNQGELVADRAYGEDVERTEKPEFIVKIPARTGDVNIAGLGAAASKAIVRLYGDKGGIVANDLQAEKLRAQGISDFEPWLLAKIKDELTGNKAIEEHHTFDIVRHLPSSWGQRDIWYMGKIVTEDDELRKHFKFPAKLPARDKDTLDIADAMIGNFYEHRYPDIKEIRKLMKEVKLHPIASSIRQKIQDNAILRILETDDLYSQILHNPTLQKRLRKLVLHVLEG